MPSMQPPMQDKALLYQTFCHQAFEAAKGNKVVYLLGRYEGVYDAVVISPSILLVH